MKIQLGQQTHTLLLEIRNHIAHDDLVGAIAQLQYLLQKSPLLDEATLQSARLNDLRRQIRLGLVDESQASVSKNQVRAGLLDLLRDLEKKVAETEGGAVAEYQTIVDKIKANRGAGTSEVLKNKTTDDLDETELSRLLERDRVIKTFEAAKISVENLTAHEALLRLSLAENGHIFKGTFLCLGKQNQIRTICQTATEAKFIVFRGTDRANILELETVTGNIIQQYEEMMMMLRRRIPLGRDREKSKDVYEIPMVAVREFVANAFVHRNYGDEVRSYIQVELYDDRLEIKSPGHLPKNVDVNKIQGTVLVNPSIAAIFHLWEYIEQAGTGINTAQQALREHGLAPAVIGNIDHPEMVKVIIRRNNGQQEPHPFKASPADEFSWKIALQTHSMEAYQAYLAQWPNGLHASEAAQKIEELNSETLWAYLHAHSNPELLESNLLDYLQAYPDGTHAKEARAQIAAFEEKREAERKKATQAAADKEHPDA